MVPSTFLKLQGFRRSKERRSEERRRDPCFFPCNIRPAPGAGARTDLQGLPDRCGTVHDITYDYDALRRMGSGFHSAKPSSWQEERIGVSDR